jgi:hypothetical protein
VKVSYRQAASDDLIRQFRYYLTVVEVPEIAIRFRDAVRQTWDCSGNSGSKRKQVATEKAGCWEKETFTRMGHNASANSNKKVGQKPGLYTNQERKRAAE